MVGRFTLDDHNLGTLTKRVSSHFTTQSELDQLRSFFLAHPEAGAGARARKQAEERVENNMRWLEEYRGVIQEWLAQRGAGQSI